MGRPFFRYGYGLDGPSGGICSLRNARGFEAMSCKAGGKLVVMDPLRRLLATSPAL